MAAVIGTVAAVAAAPVRAVSPATELDLGAGRGVGGDVDCWLGALTAVPLPGGFVAAIVAVIVTSLAQDGEVVIESMAAAVAAAAVASAAAVAVLVAFFEALLEAVVFLILSFVNVLISFDTVCLCTWG